MPATINGTSGFGGNLTGNVTGNADTATTAGKFSTTSGDAPIYGCRAWVNFDGTKDTTGAASTSNTNRLIRASGNVTSVLRNGLGDYTITFTTAMPDANYAVLGSVAGSTTADQRSFITASNAALAAGSVRVLCVDVNNTVNDCNSQQVVILR
jgi:hypothetical protein